MLLADKTYAADLGPAPAANGDYAHCNVGFTDTGGLASNMGSAFLGCQQSSYSSANGGYELELRSADNTLLGNALYFGLGSTTQSVPAPLQFRDSIGKSQSTADISFANSRIYFYDSNSNRRQASMALRTVVDGAVPIPCDHYLGGSDGDGCVPPSTTTTLPPETTTTSTSAPTSTTTTVVASNADVVAAIDSEHETTKLGFGLLVYLVSFFVTLRAGR
jgi:hypothetical protein